MEKNMSDIEEGIILGIGWMYAEACVSADRNIDIRKVDCSQYPKRAIKDLTAD